jgi:hypothetical protein
MARLRHLLAEVVGSVGVQKRSFSVTRRAAAGRTVVARRPPADPAPDHHHRVGVMAGPPQSLTSRLVVSMKARTPVVSALVRQASPSSKGFPSVSGMNAMSVRPSVGAGRRADRRTSLSAPNSCHRKSVR